MLSAVVAALELLQGLDARVAEHRAHEVQRELVVAGRHRRVRREDAACAAPRSIVLGAWTPRVALPSCRSQQLEREQRRVAFVHVVSRDARCSRALAACAAPPIPSTISWQRR